MNNDRGVYKRNGKEKIIQLYFDFKKKRKTIKKDKIYGGCWECKTSATTMELMWKFLIKLQVELPYFNGLCRDICSAM